MEIGNKDIDSVKGNTAAELDDLALARALIVNLESADLAGAEQAVDLVRAVDLAIRAAQLLVFRSLYEHRGRFPATVQTLLSRPGEDLQVSRDAQASPGETLGFINILDMLSDHSLPCVSREMHRGWQDKKQSCRLARQITTAELGFSLDQTQRDLLLLALALRNRVMRMPPPVSLDRTAAREALAAVLDLVESLAPRQKPFTGLRHRLMPD